VSSAGVVQSGFPFTTGLNTPRSVAIDGTGNAWITSNSTLTKLSPSAVQVGSSPFSGNGLSGAYSVAIDNSGNAWVANQNGVITSVSEFKNDGSAVSGSPFTSGGVNTPKVVAIDGAGNAWVGNNLPSSISVISSGGTAISPSTGYVPAGVSQCIGLAVDGSGNVWIADPSSLQLTEIIGAAVPVVTPLALGAKNNTLGTRP
jgi:ligand-binding sensor domain-containing protein